MYKYRIILGVVTTLAMYLTSHAQVDPGLENLRTVVPPSPNAASLAKFGEWPVSEYTGLPNISIPIYELKGRSQSVPITLGYHSAGIRVGDIASWVGLGWALNAGGCITRSVQGLPDDYGYYTTAQNFTDHNNLCSPPLSSTALAQAQGGSAQGTMDSQQDNYYLNVLGKSYRIYLKGDTSAYTMPASNIKIVSNYLTNDSSSWTVLLEDGTKLLFGGPYSSTNPYTEMTNNVRFGAGDDGGGNSYISSWYLRSMTSPTGETFNFTYTSAAINNDTHCTESDYVSYWTGVYESGSGGTNSYLPFMNSLAVSSHIENVTTSQLSLNTIESDLTRVYFIASGTPRTDLQGGIALSEIKVLSKATNTYTHDWLFNYTFTPCTGGNEITGGSGDPSYCHNRMKLMSLVQNATDNSTSLTWSFAYNPLALPSRRSFAQDYWGFYNGATGNTSLLPTEPFNPNSSPLASDYSYYSLTNEGFMDDIGQNRTPNPQYMQAEMLQTITYPTGGKSVLNFEPNTMPAQQEVFTPTGLSSTLNYNYGTTNVVDTFSYPFYLSKPEYVYYDLTSSISQEILQDFPGALVKASILDSAGNVITTMITSGASWFNLYVPGHYRFKVYTNIPRGQYDDAGASVSAEYDFKFSATQGVQTISRILGGLRINNMQQYDGISATPVNSKYYVYDSAFILNPVDSLNDFITSQVVINTGGTGWQNNYTKLTRNTSTKYALGSIQGGTVGYGKVTAYDGFNGANGYTVSSFSCDPTTTSTLTASKIFPYPPLDQYEWRNGLLLSEITYNASGQPLKATKNSYNFVQTNRVTDFKVGYATIGEGAGCANGAYGVCGIYPICYSNTDEQLEHTTTTDITYSTATGDAVSQTTNFYYDDALNMQPVRTVTLDSKTDTVLTYSRTALEETTINGSIPLTATATTALNTMIANNMVSQPVESEQYIKGVLMKKVLTNYKVESNGYIQPDNVMLQEASNPIETRVLFNRYDAYGNLVQQQKDNGAYRTYIWDYLHQYPIAQCINADSVDMAYSSFEADGSGTWTIPSASRDTGGITGGSCYNVSNGGVTRTGLTSTTSYVVSFWARTTSSVAVAGGSGAVVGKTIGGWTYHEYALTGTTSATVSGSGDIDELRLYPATAQMTTYTYSPLVGMTTQCDVDNRATYYEYDALARLADVKDQDRNVLKRYCYNYNGQAEDCALPNYPEPVIVTNNSTVATYVTLTNTVTQQSYTFNAAAGTTAVQVGQVLAGTYTVTMGLSSPSSSYFISYTIGTNTQTNCYQVNFSNIAVNAPLTIVMNHVASVAVNASDGTNQNITMSFAGTLGTYPFSAAPGNNGLAGYIPVGTYTVTIKPLDSSKAYPIDFTVNGSTVMNWQSQTFYSVNGNSAVTLSANAPASIPVLVQNTTNLTITARFINSYNDTISFSAAPGSNGTVGYVPQVVYNVTMGPPLPASPIYPIIYTANGNTQTYYSTVAYGGVSLPGSANLIAAPVPTVAVNSADGINQHITETFTNTWGGTITFGANPGNNGVSGNIPQGAYTLSIAPGSPYITYPILWNFNGNIQYFYNTVTYANLSITGAVSISASVPPNISVVASNSTNEAFTIWLMDTNSSEIYGNYTSGPGTSNATLATVPSGQYLVFMNPPGGNTSTIVYTVNGTSVTSTAREQVGGTFTGTITINLAP